MIEMAQASTLGWGICLFWYKLIFCEGSGFFQYLFISLFLQKLVNVIFVVSRRVKYARNVQLKHEFPLSNRSDRNVESPACGHFSYLRPPAGQNKICVDVLFSKLLCHKQSQWAVLVVDVLLGGVAQDGVGIVNLLELLRSFWVVWVLVRMKFQRQFPAKTSKIISHTKKEHANTHTDSHADTHTSRDMCRDTHKQICGHASTDMDTCECQRLGAWLTCSTSWCPLWSRSCQLPARHTEILQTWKEFSVSGGPWPVSLTASYLSGKQRAMTSLAFWKLFLVVISPPMFCFSQDHFCLC